MTKSLLGILAMSSILWTSCSTTTSTDGSDNDTTVLIDGNAPAAGTRTVRTQLSESDSYVDLRTGQPLRLRMGEGGLYTAETGDLDLYVNTSTGDTFYRGEAFPVSGHLMRDAGGAYTVDQSWFDTEYADNSGTGMGAGGMDSDPDKMRVEEDGDYKMKNKDGDIKEKLKVDGDGKDVKYKYKDDATDTKIKMTEDQIKIKDENGKTEIESDGSIKTKPNR